MAEIDREHNSFNFKHHSMDDSIGAVTASIYKLATYVLGVSTDMNALRYRLTAHIQQLIVVVQAIVKQPDLP
jgi:hypothetical protein